MKRYRIVTNGEKFRVQYRVKIGPIDYWRDDFYYEVNDAYPKVVKRPLEFDAFEDAETYTAEQLKDVKSRRPRAKHWHTVRKYSDKQGGPVLTGSRSEK